MYFGEMVVCYGMGDAVVAEKFCSIEWLQEEHLGRVSSRVLPDLYGIVEGAFLPSLHIISW